jgi:hypothetical protein
VSGCRQKPARQPWAAKIHNDVRASSKDHPHAVRILAYEACSRRCKPRRGCHSRPPVLCSIIWLTTLTAAALAMPPSPLAAALNVRFRSGSASCSAASVIPATRRSMRLSPVGHWPTARLAVEVTLLTHHLG